MRWREIGIVGERDAVHRGRLTSFREMEKYISNSGLSRITAARLRVSFASYEFSAECMLCGYQP